MTSTFRYYQQEANIAICDELLTNKKCLVKMFCGTGKSLLMRKCSIIDAAKLVVYVFPSLSLIDQFYTDYLSDFPSDDILKISSELEATTDPVKIAHFLSKQTKKIVCVTYHSYGTLLENLGGVNINVCMFDEAHHAVGQTYQKLIFENDLCEKQIFFTATPKNANGIVMYDREQLDESICGKLVYDYSYLKGVVEGYLNPFEIRVDMYTENTNKSVYASIARAILTTGNNMCLTFHADVNTGRDTSVNRFVNDAEFKRTFKEIQKSEFPREKKYKKIQMISSASKPSERKKMLEDFDATPDNEVMVISSCETIGEGIDTKNANMCVFVDPKTSYVKIIQNIGRIVRKVFGVDKPNSTILIPCWVDKTKYVECDGDREKCDAVIRQDMSTSGNFNGILNVLSALKQEDEELYDICLNYPSSYSPQEIRSNLQKQGFKTLDPIGDGSLLENIRFVLDAEIDFDEYADCETDEEIIMRIAEDNDVCVEIHTTSLENPIEIYNLDCEGREIIRLYRSDDTDEDCDDDDVMGTRYQPIVKISGEKKSNNKLSAPKRENRMRVNVHTNPDVQVLWNISSDVDITKDICSCVIDCEVITYDPMKIAVGIVERAKARNLAGENYIPRRIPDIKRMTDDLIQENKDAEKLKVWKHALKIGKASGNKCSDEVRDYLDENLPGWRTEVDFDKKAMENAKSIVERANSRRQTGRNNIPCQIQKTKRTTDDLIQEHKDACTLFRFKQALKGKGHSKCSDEVRDYLDENLPDWRTDVDFDKKAMEDAVQIVDRAKARTFAGEKLLPRQIQKTNRTTDDLIQEHNDATRLSVWKEALKGSPYRKCCDKVCDYLDENLPDWRTEVDFDKKAMEDATLIVERAKARELIGERLLPRGMPFKKSRTSPELEQEHKDATRLSGWKRALKGRLYCNCSDEVRDYLDENLPDWRTEVNFDKKAMEDATSIVERAKARELIGERLLPRGGRKLTTDAPDALKQENKDAQKLGDWKKALKNKGTSKCPVEIRDYLDKELPGWRTEVDFDKNAMEAAENIVERANKRHLADGRLVPRLLTNITLRTSPELEQEHKDATKLGDWKKSLKGTKSSKCSDEVRDYLDKELPGWRTELDNKAMEFAENIVERANKRHLAGGRLVPRLLTNITSRTSPELEQEYKDAAKIGYWKQALKKGTNKCPVEVRDYLDENLPDWRTEVDFDKKAMEDATSIVERAKARHLAGGRQVPRRLTSITSPELEQEYKDALKLSDWKKALKGAGTSNCTDEVRDYLDKNLPGWRSADTSQPKPKKSMKLNIPATPPPQEPAEHKRERVKSELEILHQRYKTLTSQNLRKEFTENPDLWAKYHEISEENEESFPEDGIPRNRIIHELNKIQTKRTKSIVDMGCGKAQISQHFAKDPRFHFINYDHVSSNDSVTSCDISRTPLDDNSVEICILSMAMWGSNCEGYITEASRILESNGELYIIEPTKRKRWSQRDEHKNIIPGKEGDLLKAELEKNGFRIKKHEIEKFCLFICSKLA
jgi:superfamily II DNA or RNA helicase